MVMGLSLSKQLWIREFESQLISELQKTGYQRKNTSHLIAGSDTKLLDFSGNPDFLRYYGFDTTVAAVADFVDDKISLANVGDQERFQVKKFT